LNRLDRKKSQWLVATRTDGYWASLVGFIFSFLFFLWPIIILKRRRNACRLGNKVAVSYYLVETQKKKTPQKTLSTYTSITSSKFLCPFLSFDFLRSFQRWEHLHWILLTIIPLVLHFVFNLYILGRMILLTFLVSNCHKCWSPIPGGYSLKSSPAVGY
jgi:hypothetical protein